MAIYNKTATNAMKYSNHLYVITNQFIECEWPYFELVNVEEHFLGNWEKAD